MIALRYSASGETWLRESSFRSSTSHVMEYISKNRCCFNYDVLNLHSSTCRFYASPVLFADVKILWTRRSDLHNLVHILECIRQLDWDDSWENDLIFYQCMLGNWPFSPDKMSKEQNRESTEGIQGEKSRKDTASSVELLSKNCVSILRLLGNPRPM